MNRQRRKTLQLALASLLSLKYQALMANPLPLNPRDPRASYGALVNYDIYRKNKRIGKHTVRFSNDGDTLIVNVESKITVTVLKVPVYRFNYQSTETWIDGELQQVTATTNDNGKQSRVEAVRTGITMLLTDKAGKQSPSNVSYTSNHWNSDVLKSKELFNTLTGKANSIVLENLGKTSLTVNSDSIEATHYRLAGDLKTDLWYDEQGRWIQLRFKGDDGSVIEYRCKGFNL